MVNIKQKRRSVTQFVEKIKDLTRQLLSPPGGKHMRAWFLNGTSLKGLNKAKVINPTKGFEELIQRAQKIERKRKKKAGFSCSKNSSSSGSSESEEEPAKKKQRD